MVANEDRQAAQLLSPRKAKITVKDRGNVCSEFSPNHYRHDSKSKKCQVTEGSMTAFRTGGKKVEIGHCCLMWLGFYFSLHLLGSRGQGCFKQENTEWETLKRFTSHTFISICWINFTPRQVSNNSNIKQETAKTGWVYKSILKLPLGTDKVNSSLCIFKASKHCLIIMSQVIFNFLHWRWFISLNPS